MFKLEVIRTIMERKIKKGQLSLLFYVKNIYVSLNIHEDNVAAIYIIVYNVEMLPIY